MLEISDCTMSKLRHGRQISTRLKFNKYNGINNKKLIQQKKLNYEKFNILKNKLNVKTYSLLKMLGITVYRYKKMKNDAKYEVIIKDIYIQHRVNLIKIDLKYQTKNSQYYSIRRMKNICKKRGINIYQFAEYYNNNPKHYKFNLMIIEKSSKGFWISLDNKIPNEFINKHYNELINRLTKISTNLFSSTEGNIYSEDLVQETINQLYFQCGIIIQNFYFDIKVLFNILMAKAKCYMLNIYRKKYRTKNVISYNSFSEKNNIDYINIFRDDKYDPQHN